MTALELSHYSADELVKDAGLGEFVDIQDGGAGLLPK